MWTKKEGDGKSTLSSTLSASCESCRNLNSSSGSGNLLRKDESNSETSEQRGNSTSGGGADLKGPLLLGSGLRTEIPHQLLKTDANTAAAARSSNIPYLEVELRLRNGNSAVIRQMAVLLHRCKWIDLLATGQIACSNVHVHPSKKATGMKVEARWKQTFASFFIPASLSSLGVTIRAEETSGKRKLEASSSGSGGKKSSSSSQEKRENELGGKFKKSSVQSLERSDTHTGDKRIFGGKTSGHKILGSEEPLAKLGKIEGKSTAAEFPLTHNKGRDRKKSGLSCLANGRAGKLPHVSSSHNNTNNISLPPQFQLETRKPDLKRFKIPKKENVGSKQSTSVSLEAYENSDSRLSDVDQDNPDKNDMMDKILSEMSEIFDDLPDKTSTRDIIPDSPDKIDSLDIFDDFPDNNGTRDVVPDKISAKDFVQDNQDKMCSLDIFDDFPDKNGKMDDIPDKINAKDFVQDNQDKIGLLDVLDDFPDQNGTIDVPDNNVTKQNILDNAETPDNVLDFDDTLIMDISDDIPDKIGTIIDIPDKRMTKDVVEDNLKICEMADDFLDKNDRMDIVRDIIEKSEMVDKMLDNPDKSGTMNGRPDKDGSSSGVSEQSMTTSVNSSRLKLSEQRKYLEPLRVDDEDMDVLSLDVDYEDDFGLS